MEFLTWKDSKRRFLQRARTLQNLNKKLRRGIDIKKKKVNKRASQKPEMVPSREGILFPLGSQMKSVLAFLTLKPNILWIWSLLLKEWKDDEMAEG